MCYSLGDISKRMIRISYPSGSATTGDGLVNVYTEAGTIGAAVTAATAGGPAMVVVAPDGKTVLGRLGFGPSNKGELRVGDDKGAHISIGEFEGRPMAVGVFGETGKELVSLRTDDRGGRFVIGQNTGEIILEGGITDSGRGVLRAGSRTGGPIPATGLPSVIMGLEKK